MPVVVEITLRNSGYLSVSPVNGHLRDAMRSLSVTKKVRGEMAGEARDEAVQSLIHVQRALEKAAEDADAHFSRTYEEGVLPYANMSEEAKEATRAQLSEVSARATGIALRVEKAIDNIRRTSD